MKLIFGAKGQLGKDFCEFFDKNNIEYRATDKNEIDITQATVLKEYIREIHNAYKVDAIINCAAYTDVDNAEIEKDDCFKVNMDAAVNLAMIAQEINANYLTFSTDYIFSGRIENYIYNDSVGYSEDDEAQPISVYGQSKYESEILIKQIIENYPLAKIYILRTSWVFGKGSFNFVDKVIKWSEENDILKIVDDQISSPTYSKDIVQYSLKLLEKNASSGIYNFTNDGIVSRYEQAKFILEKLNWPGKILPTKTEFFSFAATRPKFSKLNCKKIKETLSEGIPHWTNAIERYLKEINKI